MGKDYCDNWKGFHMLNDFFSFTIALFLFVAMFVVEEEMQSV